jgi:hypothetical protein
MAFIIPQPGTAGQVYTAAAHNILVDNFVELAPFFSGWTSYTPTLAQGGATNIGKTLTYAKSLKIGRMVMVQVIIDVTGTGDANNAVTCTLPYARARGGFDEIGHGSYFVGVGVKFPLLVSMNNATTVVRFQYTHLTADQNLGAAGPFTSAVSSGQTLSFSCFYEAAS